ncbi:UvrABC system protein B [Philodulcilactobacillus myokoensis]|uniref:UvrABC system protein B n=1 Tax=Philodulcilactobacillus myokoensis TaxID=2929573 RepID=A0A9W6EST9_9LACO|nr:excinuclease ABC subunit UvrB [Philodulcilactobacillus myokoensis]GLB47135.1 UvrABC system protein B [Philodulcilactobacillus myokoensis]
MIRRDTSHKYDLVSKYQPTGDQPNAIRKLTQGVKDGKKAQILWGATGTGKTFTISNVIKNVNKPVLVLSHNKTLAGQLYSEFKKLFPHNKVEYFVSYYDYYQPEAYVPSSDTYIEKDASINDEIDKLRHAATTSLLTRNDTIVVASVSAIFGLGSPKEYFDHIISLKVGQEINRNDLLRQLVDLQFERNDINFQRGNFRVRGDIVEVFPSSMGQDSYRIEFFGDEIDQIKEVNTLTGEIISDHDSIAIFPATHFLTTTDVMSHALKGIGQELKQQVKHLHSKGKLLEAQRLKQRTTYDIEMMREMGYTNGIENYSRYMDGRKPGEPPYTLLDFFPKDFLMVIDESHQTIPQIGGMFNGDKARKKQLIDYGFRLPSALDNRPLKLNEFEKHINQVVYMSATPGPYEEAHNDGVVEQIIRPTGLLDPTIDVRPSMGQMDDLVGEINKRVKHHERTFITVLTKKMAEDLTDYLKDLGIKVRYLHSGIKTLERTRIIHDLRLGKFDVLVGINLLREGIDVPEVSLVAILDADKEGFLRNTRSLIQTIGRASRNSHGSVIMYADTITKSMHEAIDQTKRRRKLQIQFNHKHNVTPTTIKKPIRPLIHASGYKDKEDKKNNKDNHFVEADFEKMSQDDQNDMLDRLKDEMKDASKAMDFEQAANLRDVIFELEGKQKGNPKKHHMNHN